MGDALHADTVTAVLDHDYFSSQPIAALNPCLRHWEAVRAKHSGHQMLALKGCNPLKSFIASELNAKEEQLLGCDLVSQQHAHVEVQAKLETFMGRGRATWSENEKGFTSNDVEVNLQNGAFQVRYSKVDFIVYVFRVSYGGNSEMELTIVVWEGNNLGLGKQLIADAFTWSSTLREQMWVYHGALGGWRKDSNFYRAVTSANAQDMVLPSDILEQLYRDTQGFFSSAKLYHDLAVTWKRGILLLGPPGNGKTNMIRILLQKCKVPALYVQSAKTDRGAEMGMHAIFAKARQCAPCILILEDIETLVSGDSRSFMLNQLDGIESNDGILVIATANDISKLDAAILQRPSRFDAKYVFHLPDKDLRRRFAAKWLSSKIGEDRIVYDSDTAVDLEALLDAIVQSTEGWSFAFLKELFMSYLLGMATAAVKAEAQQPHASVQAFIDNIQVLSKQITLATAVGPGK
jgi:hypothetical protein